MGLFKNFFVKDIEVAIENYEAKKARSNITPTNRNSKIKDFIVKTVGYINSYYVGRDMPALPEYDFDEIRRASETDSYIKESLDKYKRLIYKAGYYMKSENQAGIDYLNTRFRVMSYATGKPMDVLFQEIADDLITYSNCIIVKTRIDNIMQGVKATGLFGKKPVGGYFRVDPATISISRDQNGNILQYTQKICNGKEKNFQPNDIIHIYMNKESSNSFGTPKIIAALEDVKILRRLEGNVLAIVHRFAMPIFHWKIGKTQQGFQATDREIDEARSEIEGMSLDGTVITNEKTEIKVLGAEGNAINANEYLKYFENRVFTALDTSAAQMGRGGAKQDADSMEGQAHDYVKYVQKTIKIFLENYMISELLLEGGFNPIIKTNDIVEYIFNELNLDTKIKVENHEMLKYQSNMQTLAETRRRIGYKEEVNSNELYKNSIEVQAQIKIAKGTANAQLNVQKQMAELNANIAQKANDLNKEKNDKGKDGIGNLSNGKAPTATPNKDVESRNRPSNQYGTTSVKVKESLEIKEKVIRNKKIHMQKYSLFYKKLNDLKNNLSNNEEDIDYLMSLAMESCKAEIKYYINKEMKLGLDKAIKELSSANIDVPTIGVADLPKDLIIESAEKDIKKILKDISKKIGSDRSYMHVDTVFNALQYRFRFMIEYILPKSFWYAYVNTLKKAGIKEAKVIFGESPDTDNHPEIINLNNYRLDDIPAYHSFCDCRMKMIKNKAVS